MRLSSLGFACVLILFVCASSAFAAEHKTVTPKGVISLNYWDAKLVKSMPTRSESSAQKFFPIIIGSRRFTNHWSATAEWGKSGYSAIDPARNGNLPEKASRSVVGIKRDIAPGVYYSLSYPYMKLQQDNNAGYKLTATISGMQVGGGMGMYLKEPHLTFGVDFNFVPSMNVKYVTPAMRVRSKGPGLDAKFVVSYKFRDPGAAIHFGYRYMSLTADNAMLGNIVAVPKTKFLMRGMFMGMKYVF